MDSDFRPRKPAKSLRTAPNQRSAETQTETNETFRTPDEVAASETGPSIASLDMTLSETENPKVSLKNRGTGKGWREKLSLHWPPGRKEAGVAAAVLLLAGVGGYLVFGGNDAKPVAKVQVKKVTKKVAPTTVPSTLSGLQVDPALNSRPVVGVMIENSLDARPQSGLADAGVVFEAIAEGGITRFLALYQDTAPADIGPVRSARPYYLEWALGFDAAYAHVGGSPEALNSIKAWGVRDLDQFANAGAYRRISTRAAPHNVYSNVDGLTQLAVSKGYASSTYTGFVRKAEPAKNKRPAIAAKSIDITLSGPLYNVRYDYNPETNTYNRSEGGAAHMDANGNRQISPKTVVAMVTPYGLNGKYSVYQVVGSGPVTIFQDGIATTGTWTKKDQKSQITFTDTAGKPISLNPGQTWITAVSDASKITYTP